MKKSTFKNIIKEAISDMEVSLKLSNGKIIHGLARTNPKALSLQIGSNTYFSFWEGKFTLSGTGSVTIVEGVDDYSQEWFLKATEEYLKAMEDAYPERFKYNTTGPIGMNESTSQDAFMAGWNQSKANLGKGKIKGDIRDIDAWMEYSQGEGSEEEKDAFIYGWFKARTTTDYQDVEMQMFDMARAGKRNTPEYDKLIKRRAELEKAKMNEERDPYNGFLSTDDTKTVIIRSNDDWEKLATSLNSEGFKHQGSLNSLNPNRGLTQMSNYAKFPYEVIINKTQKLVDFGEHTLNENKMTKRDIIRIINEEVEIALDEMYDPIYDTMLPEILVMISAGVIGVKKAIKYLKEKGLDKQAIIDVIKKAKSKLNESINEEEEVYNVIDRETEKLITDTPIRKSLALRLAAKKKGWIIQKHKESVNENEGMTKSLKDIDPSLSLTKYDTTPPKFKITYIRKDDMSKEMEEELVAWVLSKGGRVDSVETMFDVEDGERYYYPYVKFSYK